MPVHTGIQLEPLSAQPLIDWARDEHVGAIVTFSGTTRNSFNGKAVRSLAYDAYVPRAERTLASIAMRAAENEGVFNVALVHRIGDVPLTQESVVIVVAAAHRQEAWQTAEWILEEVKRTAEIWKKEIYDDGSSLWVEGSQRVVAESFTASDSIS